MNINQYALRKERSLQKIIKNQPKPNITAIGVCSETQVTHHMDKFHLGVLLNDIRHEPQKYPECHMAWIDWLNGQPKGTIIGKNF